MANEDEKEERFNPRRRLCPDGSCVGIIGPDGKCTICGHADAGAQAPATDEAPAEQLDALPAEDAGEDDFNDQDDERDGDAAAAGFDPQRRLCSDDACIGVIGSDDCCSVCGRPARG